MKDRAAEYWDSIPKVVSGLKDLVPTSRLLTSDLVAKSIVALAEIPNQVLSGQSIAIDDSWSLMDPAQVAKSVLDKYTN